MNNEDLPIFAIMLSLYNPFINNGLVQIQNGRIYLILRGEIYLQG